MEDILAEDHLAGSSLGSTLRRSGKKGVRTLKVASMPDAHVL